MNYATVSKNVQQLVSSPQSSDAFVYEFLLAYGTPKSSIARLKSGDMNMSKTPGELLLKKKLYFKDATADLFGAEQDLFSILESLKTAKGTKTHAPRFLVVTDFKQLVAIDSKKDESLDCPLAELGSHFDFFLPLAGMEKTKLSNENPADIKAAERMAKLFDAIKAHNPEFVSEKPHAMNVFLARLLFCLFAEDTGIFPENAVSNSIASHTAVDASDLHDFFVKLFDILDRKSRGGLPEHLKIFPYVNGGLFRDHHAIPEFSIKARRMMIEAGELNWSDINPDIFGSMFQAVIDPEERHNLGQHYTSVTNIMKVIEPLFLNDFRQEFEKASNLQRGKSQALHRLLDRIAKVKIFDPACGSGNFLIIAYKELRKLEMDVFAELQTLDGTLPLSGLDVSQFYGIEIADFAAETAVLALWLTEHQMNLESKRVCGQAPDNLPLRDGAHIVCANACRIDWESACPKEESDEIYILGNPPYLGGKLQDLSQKQDLQLLFGGSTKFKNLDYISSWFIKASQFIDSCNCKSAFVTTNSISQGDHVGLLWHHVLSANIEIGFAHTSFKWTNSAKGNAGVTCAIVGLRNSSDEPKFLYQNGIRNRVDSISPYLTAGPDLVVQHRKNPISNFPPLFFGSMPRDGGHLSLDENELKSIIAEDPKAQEFCRPYTGSVEFIRGIKRWCLWIDDSRLRDAEKIQPIETRLKMVESFRNSSKAESTRKFASQPHRFVQKSYQNKPSIIIPSVSSERREYIPIGFLEKGTVTSNLAFAIYDASPTIFSLLTSRMHMTWVRAVAGRLEERLRYSAGICYNTFPVPNLSEAQKQELTGHVMNVLQERENHPEKTMAQLYDPDKMPNTLREAHHQLDLAVDRLYRKAPFTSDEERLEHLFKRYEAMIKKEAEERK